MDENALPIRLLSALKRALNRILGLVGLRLILVGEEEALRGRIERLLGDQKRMVG